MKVIFLDIDGVLNTEETFEKMIDNHLDIEIDEFRVEYLKRIIDATDAKIVLSSSWKIFFVKKYNTIVPISHRAVKLMDIFDKYDLSIFDTTPYLYDGKRQDEINLWLYEHPDVTNFVVFDDETTLLMDFVGSNLIKTTTLPDGELLTDMSQIIGLCEEHIEKAINILSDSKYNKLDRIEVDLMDKDDIIHFGIFGEREVDDIKLHGKKTLLVRISGNKWYDLSTEHLYDNILYLNIYDVPIKLVDDNFRNGLKISFNKLNQFILNNDFDEIIVHCSLGVSRSPAIMICIARMLDCLALEDKVKEKFKHYNKAIVEEFDKYPFVKKQIDINKFKLSGFFLDGYDYDFFSEVSLDKVKTLSKKK